MGSAPAEHSGIASAVNNTVARAAGLFAVAVLPLAAGLTGAAALAPSELAAGFRTAVYISGAACAAGGLLAVLDHPQPDPQAGTRRRTRMPPLLRGQWPAACRGPRPGRHDRVLTLHDPACAEGAERATAAAGRQR